MAFLVSALTSRFYLLLRNYKTDRQKISRIRQYLFKSKRLFKPALVVLRLV